jgi:hypothetical protein
MDIAALELTAAGRTYPRAWPTTFEATSVKESSRWFVDPWKACSAENESWSNGVS